MKFSVYIKMINNLKGLTRRVESSAVTDLWAVPDGWDHCRCNQKRFSGFNLYHRDSYHKVHRLLIFSCCWRSAGQISVLVKSGPSWASHPARSGEVFILCSIHSTACSAEENFIHLCTLPAEPAYTTAGITLLWLHPKSGTVTKSLDSVSPLTVECWRLTDEKLSVWASCKQASM